jgi:hypothetical protein
MAQQQALTIKLHILGVRETLAAFRKLPKEASNSLREQSMRLAASLAQHVAGAPPARGGAAAARADSPQSALMAPTVKAIRDRVPAISAGGTSRVGRNQKPAFKILFGSEFGARRYKQFRPHLGTGSYWMFRTVQHNEAELSAAWGRVAAAIAESFRVPTASERIAQIQADQHAQVEAIFADVHARFDALMSGFGGGGDEDE